MPGSLERVLKVLDTFPQSSDPRADVIVKQLNADAILEVLRQVAADLLPSAGRPRA